jgi:hypothetical protein
VHSNDARASGKIICLKKYWINSGGAPDTRSEVHQFQNILARGRPFGLRPEMKMPLLPKPRRWLRRVKTRLPAVEEVDNSDFEIVVKKNDDCDPQGCVLAASKDHAAVRTPHRHPSPSFPFDNELIHCRATGGRPLCCLGVGLSQSRDRPFEAQATAGPQTGDRRITGGFAQLSTAKSSCNCFASLRFRAQTEHFGHWTRKNASNISRRYRFRLGNGAGTPTTKRIGSSNPLVGITLLMGRQTRLHNVDA